MGKTTPEAALKIFQDRCSCLSDAKALAGSLVTETVQRKRAHKLSSEFQLWGLLTVGNSFH